MTEYRYTLTRHWTDTGPNLLWIMLNPSSADDSNDDHTIRQCRSLSARWGFGSLSVVNLFAMRSPHPKDLILAPDPVGPDNWRVLTESVDASTHIIAAWGNVPQMLAQTAGEVQANIPGGRRQIVGMLVTLRHHDLAVYREPDFDVHPVGEWASSEKGDRLCDRWRQQEISWATYVEELKAMLTKRGA